MKYITLLLLLTAIGCAEPNLNRKDTDYIVNSFGDRIEIVEIDSCEYLIYGGGNRMALAHKGNCKFCKRRQ